MGSFRPSGLRPDTLGGSHWPSGRYSGGIGSLTVAETIRADTSELSRLGRTLVDAGPRIAAGFHGGIRVAGAEVAETAKANAAWSKQIPGSIRFTASGDRVAIEAGGIRAPDAAPLEHGGLLGTFRHPVFGNRQVWVDQLARPFLQPALDSNVDNVAESLAENVRKSMEEA